MSENIFTLNIPISKVDEEQRMVTGVATAEVLDSQGDIVDYEASKKAFADWIGIGNIREMHGPVAVAKGIDVQFDDANKQVILTSKVSESADGENAWIKIKEKIYTGYSIGGKVFKVAKDKAVDGANRVIDYALSEVSFVDNPACPDAKFVMVKSVDGKPARVDELVKAGVAVVDGDARDANGNSVAEVVAVAAPIKGGTKVPKQVYGRDGRSTTAKGEQTEMKKSVWDAQEAIRLACELSYLLMVEGMENEPDQVEALTTAFNALRDFAAKEVAEGDDYVLEGSEVMELARKAINLRKGKEVAKEEIEKTNVVGGEERDETAAVTETQEEAGRPVNDTEERAVEAGVAVDTGEEVTVKTEGEVVEEAEAEAEAEVEEVKEEVAEEVAPAVESKESDKKEEKSDAATDLIKSVQSLVTKIDENNNAELKKVADLVSDLGDKVEKRYAALEDRIKSLEDQPLPTKAKASFVTVEKGEEIEAPVELAELQKRQDHLAMHPEDAKPGEFEAIFRKMRQLQA